MHTLFSLLVIVSIVISLASIFLTLRMERKRHEAVEALETEKQGLKQKIQRAHDCIDRNLSRTRAAMLGVKVITKSNEDEPFKVGTLQRFEEVSASKTPMPIVTFDTEPDKEYLCFAAIVPYSETVVKAISSMTNREQWEHLSQISLPV